MPHTLVIHPRILSVANSTIDSVSYSFNKTNKINVNNQPFRPFRPFRPFQPFQPFRPFRPFLFPKRALASERGYCMGRTWNSEFQSCHLGPARTRCQVFTARNEETNAQMLQICCTCGANVVQWSIRKIQNHPSPSCATFMTDSMISLVSADGLPPVSGFVQWCPYVNHGESPNSSSRPQTECSSPKCWHWISLGPLKTSQGLYKRL